VTEAYKTLSKSVCAELTVKRSRFLCYANPVSCEAEAAEFVKEISAKHWDARHNVWAYSVREGRRERYSDDGEPQGTAGQPVLEALRARDITDAVLVVTRYFGGILLGASGLTRAYASSAGLGIEQAGTVVMRPSLRLRLVLEYPRFAQFERILLRLGGVVESSEFAQYVTVCFALPADSYEAFRSALAELVPGAATELLGEGFTPADL
jgi:uncharacterized YigZ family protein